MWLHLEMGEDEFIYMNDAQTKVARVLKKLRTQTASKTFESVEVESAAKVREHPTHLAKVVRGFENSLRASLSVSYSALLGEHDELKNRCEELTLSSQCVLDLAKVANKLRAKCANTKKSNALASSAFMTYCLKKACTHT